MMDPAHAPEWITGVTESVPTTPGPVGVGTKIRETRTLGRYTETYEIEVREFDAPRRYTAAAAMGKKAAFLFTFELADAGGATDISVRATVEGRGLAVKLFSGMAFRVIEKYDGDQLERLKAAVEKGDEAQRKGFEA